MKTMLKLIAAILPIVAQAAAPEGWQLVDRVYTPIRETVTTYPAMDANQSVFVGPGTNVILSAHQSITNAKQGDSAKFVGATLTSTANLIIKGNDSKVLFDGATVSTTGTFAMNDSGSKPTGDVEILFVNGTTASFENGFYWQSGALPTAARFVVSNATVTVGTKNRTNIVMGEAKTGPTDVSDLTVHVERDGTLTTTGFQVTGNANSPILVVRKGGRFETTNTLQLSTREGVNASIAFESGCSAVQSGGALIANSGAKMQFKLVSPSAEDGQAIFSKLVGDYAAFNSGFIAEVNVGKAAAGTYKLMEVVGNPGNASRGVSGFEEMMANVVVNVSGSSTVTHWYTKEGSGAQTKYTWYAKVKKSGFAIVIM